MGGSLHYGTLYFCSVITGLSMVLAMFHVWRVHRRSVAVRYWLMGFGAWAFSSAIFAFTGLLPPEAIRLLGNFVGVAAATLVYVGTALFLGRPLRWRLLLPSYALASAGIIYGSLVVDSFYWRVLSYSLAAASTVLLIVIDLWSSGAGPQRAAYRFVGSVWAVLLAAMLLRAGSFILDPESATPTRVNLPQLLWFVTFNATNMLGGVGYLLMVSQRLQEKNNWARMEEIFHETLRLPPGQRAAHLQAACDGDAVLRAELESLVAAADAPTDALDDGVSLSGPRGAAGTSLVPGSRLGTYRVQRLLGQGGMGEVHLAEDAGGASVAIKLLRPEAGAHLDRFEAERRIVARLRHPGIARVFDGGVAEDGRPYMVLEYVEGEPVTAYCRSRHLPLRERLRLFQDICAAVSHAHELNVVHRDLKPGNILVTPQGRIKLLDFGVAKLLKPAGMLGGDVTVTQAVPFTPDYAAPEQLDGRSIGTATDVYALGVLLFELLTDELPWQLGSLPPSVALHKLLHEAPRRPSAAAAANRAAPVLARLLSRNLDAIVAKALQKNPKDRYAAVVELGQDIAHHLAGAPVSAAPQSLWRQRWRDALRQPRRLAAAVLLVSVLGLLVHALQGKHRQLAAAEARVVELCALTVCTPGQ